MLAQKWLSVPSSHITLLSSIPSTIFSVNQYPGYVSSWTIPFQCLLIFCRSPANILWKCSFMRLVSQFVKAILREKDRAQSMPLVTYFSHGGNFVSGYLNIYHKTTFLTFIQYAPSYIFIPILITSCSIVFELFWKRIHQMNSFFSFTLFQQCSKYG